GLDDDEPRRSPLTRPDLEATYVAGNVNLKWSIPTERAAGEPLDVAELQHLTVETKLKAAPDDKWTKIGDFAPDVTERRLQNVPGGTHQYRATWHGTDGETSPPTVVELVVPRAGLPAPEFTAELG